MKNEIHSLYQSGERVTVPGVYALVDAPAEKNQQKTCELANGHYFPDHQGRAVCWYLVEASQEMYSNEEPITTPWQSKSSYLTLH
jgi:hypothetical protein